MKIWLPYIEAGSGADSFTQNLAAGLQAESHSVVLQRFSSYLQFGADFLRTARVPDVDVVVANASVGFAFVGAAPVVSVVHHWVHDAAYHPYRTKAQALYHETILRWYESRTIAGSAHTVAVSEATRVAVMRDFDGVDPSVIRNGVDTDFFSPGVPSTPRCDGRFRILFVGNLTKRKGVDLLAPTMHRLGPEYLLEYTTGRRTSGSLEIDNSRALGRLSLSQLRDAYRRADALFVPSRLEGGPLVLFEAMSTGLPAVASDVSAMPEVIDHGRTGLLSPLDPDGFADAFRKLAGDRALASEISGNARVYARDKLSRERMSREFTRLFDSLGS